ncbi:MAG: 23S rRNA (adenine(2503)-C(2))-methyltransferase RlmN [Firmicutes bacterium]|nr:23S rRNA (adenine(2503)-C(2))-methyltransferase RlmN [Bacillota bacterium]
MIKTVDIKSMSYEECRSFFASLGEPAYRADQVLEWLHGRQVTSYDEMTNLPVSLRRVLAEASPLRAPEVLAVQSSAEGTTKYLIGLADGNAVETVLMEHDYGLSLCVSSQVGCAMGCAFCASGLGGLVRNLTCGEMVDQILAVGLDTAARSQERRVGSVVMMGSGEPLANYDNVLKFVKLINWQRGYSIGYRRITISTCGIVPGIRRLAREGLPVTLSVSLHAPDDRTRSSLMKINEVYPVGQLIEASADYADSTGRRVTYEYCLIGGVNDSRAHAESLARLVRGTLCHVNIIPLNPVEETGFARPSREAIDVFVSILRSAGIETTVRREMGADIDAACGQLRRRWGRRESERDPVKGLGKG